MMAGQLEVRPLLLRKESRTRGHVVACLLALELSRELGRRPQARFGTTDADPHAMRLPGALAALNRLRLVEYQSEEKDTVTRLPKPDARQKHIVAALAVHPPEK